MVDSHNYALAEMLKKTQKGNVLRSSWDGPLTNRLQATAHPWKVHRKILQKNGCTWRMRWKGGKKKKSGGMSIHTHGQQYQKPKPSVWNSTNIIVVGLLCRGKKKFSMCRTWEHGLTVLFKKGVALPRHSAKSLTSSSSQYVATGPLPEQLTDILANIGCSVSTMLIPPWRNKTCFVKTSLLQRVQKVSRKKKKENAPHYKPSKKHCVQRCCKLCKTTKEYT